MWEWDAVRGYDAKEVSKGDKSSSSRSTDDKAEDGWWKDDNGWWQDENGWWKADNGWSGWKADEGERGEVDGSVARDANLLKRDRTEEPVATVEEPATKSTKKKKVAWYNKFPKSWPQKKCTGPGNGPCVQIQKPDQEIWVPPQHMNETQ